MKIGKLIARVVVGALFVGHGTQKLFGWFDGEGPQATGETFEQIGLQPGRRNALAAGAAEAAGGAMLAAGLATPLAAAMLSGTMITAIRTVHLPKGLWVTKGGYEYNLVLLAALMALVDEGPGRISADAALGVEVRGAGWAAAQLVAGAAGSELALAASRAEQRRRAEHPATEPQPAADEPAAGAELVEHRHAA
jgi:putative oxidoreductase